MLRRRRDGRGQTLVEFALALPLFLIVLLGIAEGGYYVVASTIVSTATHEGARVGVLESTPDLDAIETRVIDTASSVVALAPTKIKVFLNGTEVSDVEYADRVLGDRLKVTTEYAHRPLVSYVFDQISFGASATAELMVEGPDDGGSGSPPPTATPTPAPTATPTPTPAPTATPTPTPAPTATPTPTPAPTPTPTPPGTLFGPESFEGSIPAGWGNTAAFASTTDQVHWGTYSACKSTATSPGAGSLTSPVIDTSGVSTITVDFWFRLLNMDKKLDLQFKNASGNWVTILNVNAKSLGTKEYPNDTWLHSTDTFAATSDSQFLHPGFQFRFTSAALDATRYVCIDDAKVTST